MRVDRSGSVDGGQQTVAGLKTAGSNAPLRGGRHRSRCRRAASTDLSDATASGRPSTISAPRRQAAGRERAQPGAVLDPTASRRSGIGSPACLTTGTTSALEVSIPAGTEGAVIAWTPRHRQDLRQMRRFGSAPPCLCLSFILFRLHHLRGISTADAPWRVAIQIHSPGSPTGSSSMRSCRNSSKRARTGRHSARPQRFQGDQRARPPGRRRCCATSPAAPPTFVTAISSPGSAGTNSRSSADRRWRRDSWTASPMRWSRCSARPRSSMAG